MGTTRIGAALVLLLAVQRCASDGNVGCLFSPDLCAEQFEWCFDDYAFGRCLPLYGHVDEDFLYRRELGPAELQALEAHMTRLFAEGFRWGHAYTQCVMQSALRAVQLGEELEEEPATDCEPLAERSASIETAPSGVDSPPLPPIDSHETAFVKFTPSAENPHAEFADEFYFPPLDHETHRTRGRPAGSSPTAELRLLGRPLVMAETNLRKKSAAGAEPRIFRALYNTPDAFRLGKETRDLSGTAAAPPEAAPAAAPAASQPAYTEGGLVFVAKPAAAGATDVLTADALSEADDEESRLEDLLDQYAGLEWGFKRRERLDVKKPGPPFLTNSYAFKEQTQPAHVAHHERERTVSKTPDVIPAAMQQHTAPIVEEAVPIVKDKEDNMIPEDELKPPPLRRRPPPPPQQAHVADDESSHFDLVDPTYAFVGFKSSVRSWRQGADLVNLLADLMHFDRSDFTNVRVDPNEVTFKVEEPNAVGMNATELARQIGTVRQIIYDILGVQIITAGIGDKTKLPTMVNVESMVYSERQMALVGLVLVTAGAAAIAIIVILVLVRRHARHLDKLEALGNLVDDASKDYEDLCRVRMATKTHPHGEKAAEALASGQRVVSLSRESEQSPSSRSSTSSWSEEPALSNMDISTGHMVLSYMEDHLHNKGRLEQEWVALCAYEAEPCATTIAFKPENVKKNRYPDIVPYDHSRVVLNTLANADENDYINASSITDHDPRNPAYIATQGPLANTSADFWQMVWEQGSVVMVMLTRLTENGQTLCHRYWPEEGSEIYHVYEVHLVSEHIWCDDYLVRSFYLKNIKTGETRTVTQFHFLSWPEGGVPTSTKALLEFRRKVNKSYRGRSCPIVVHCSDGAGRSGTYCLMDMVLNRMAKGAKEIDIAATLEHIRDQRAGMVRSKAQFELVLMAVAEEVHAILKALPQ